MTLHDPGKPKEGMGERCGEKTWLGGVGSFQPCKRSPGHDGAHNAKASPLAPPAPAPDEGPDELEECHGYGAHVETGGELCVCGAVSAKLANLSIRYGPAFPEATPDEGPRHQADCPYLDPQAPCICAPPEGASEPPECPHCLREAGHPGAHSTSDPPQARASEPSAPQQEPPAWAMGAARALDRSDGDWLMPRADLYEVARLIYSAFLASPEGKRVERDAVVVEQHVAYLQTRVARLETALREIKLVGEWRPDIRTAEDAANVAIEIARAALSEKSDEQEERE